MVRELIQETVSHLGLDPETIAIQRIEGGFTDAEKFVVQGGAGGPLDKLFIKLANLAIHPGEAIVLDTEAFMYRVISKLDTVSKYFPHYRDYKRDSQIAGLFIDYLPGLTWGGPWNSKTVRLLASALDEIHSTIIDLTTEREITEWATSLRDRLYKQSPYTFDRETRKGLFNSAVNFATGAFTNSRGQKYYQVPASMLKDISQTAAAFNPNADNKFLITDLNFGNIGFSNNQAYFVDPVYVELGVAETDMVNVGVNILRAVPPSQENAQLLNFVKARFLSDKAAFAYALTYWVACTSLAYRGKNDTWMDFQESCAVTALRAWSGN